MVATVILACGIGVGVSGCTTVGDDGPTAPSLTNARQGQKQVVDFVKDSAKHMPKAGKWLPKLGVAQAGVCTLPNGDEGAYYQYRLRAKGRDSRLADAKTMQAYWESLGMKTHMINADKKPVVHAYGGSVDGAKFDTSPLDGAYSIWAEMPCAPGKASELSGQDAQNRHHGTPQPGDEGAVITPDPNNPLPIPTDPGQGGASFLPSPTP